MKNRKEQIKAKGFNMVRPIDDFQEHPSMPIEFNKIKIGLKNVEDASLNLGDYKRVNSEFGRKSAVLDAIANRKLEEMRDISNFYFTTSGIYSRLCRYMAYMYRYDWFVTPYINEESVKTDKILEGFNKALFYLDNSGLKKFFGEAALKVLVNGCYYGYKIECDDRMIVQELPVKYCRSRIFSKGRPCVEFNMKYFDDAFRDSAQKLKMLKMFPEEFRIGYKKYKAGKLPPEFIGDSQGWYLLDVEKTIKFNLNGMDFPAFISVIPAIIDLDEAQDLDRKKMQQQLLKIIIQKMPIDKNGDLVFDVDEAAQLHNNAVQMLSKAIGLDVLTTFADVEVANMTDRATATTTDDLMKVERAIYNEAGVSQMQFNTDGNIALEKSILNDEAAMYNLIQQFEVFVNDLLKPFNKKPKKLYYKAEILQTTIYNYKEMSKMYKEQTQLGYSKMLPQLALGQTQSSILANAYFENDILDLVNVFIPPLSSNTMNADMVSRKNNSGGETGKSGRPTNESKGAASSEKTMQNKESQN